MRVTWSLLALLAVLPAFSLADVRAAEEEVVKALFDPSGTYNKHVRPPGQKNASFSQFHLPFNVTGEPVVVTVNIFVRHIGEIDDENKDYSISMTLRQSWNDARLQYKPSDPALEYVLLTDPEQIWVPDLFFSNEKEGHAHDLMTKNSLIRITPKGDVLYSTRVSLRLSCPMDLTNFPMDKQKCSIRMASYAYTTNDLVFQWKDSVPVQSANDLDLSPFEMQGFGLDYCNSKTNTGEYSCLRGEFLFKRQLSTYLMQAYLPLGLLVVVSWIIFWLDERSTATRVIVATLIFLATIAEASLVASHTPHSGESKAIDCYTSWTLVFVFLTLVEQLVVILVSRRETPAGVKRFDREIEEGIVMAPLMEGNGESGEGVEQAQEKKPETPQVKPNLVKQWLSTFNSTGRRIDVLARLLFPIAFILFNLTYWSSYSDYEGLRSLTVVQKIAYN